MRRPPKAELAVRPTTDVTFGMEFFSSRWQGRPIAVGVLRVFWLRGNICVI